MMIIIKWPKVAIYSLIFILAIFLIMNSAMHKYNLNWPFGPELRLDNPQWHAVQVLTDLSLLKTQARGWRRWHPGKNISTWGFVNSDKGYAVFRIKKDEIVNKINQEKITLIASELNHGSSSVRLNNLDEKTCLRLAKNSFRLRAFLSIQDEENIDWYDRLTINGKSFDLPDTSAKIPLGKQRRLNDSGVSYDELPDPMDDEIEKLCQKNFENTLTWSGV